MVYFSTAQVRNKKGFSSWVFSIPSGTGAFFLFFFPFLTFQRFSGGVGYLLFNGFSLDRGVYLAGSHWVVTAYGVFFSFLRFIISSLSTRVLFIHPCPVCFVCLRPISSHHHHHHHQHRAKHESASTIMVPVSPCSFRF